MEPQSTSDKVFISASRFIGIVLLVLMACYIAFYIWFERGSQPTPRKDVPPGTVGLDDIYVYLPSLIFPERDFQITTKFTNSSKSSVESVIVLISPELLKGFSIEGSIPPWDETYGVEKEFGGAFQAFVFNQAVLPDETIKMVFNGRHLLAGDYLGAIFICATSKDNCAGISLRTTAK